MTTFWGDKGSCMDLGKFVVVIYDTVMQSHGVMNITLVLPIVGGLRISGFMCSMVDRRVIAIVEYGNICRTTSGRYFVLIPQGWGDNLVGMLVQGCSSYE